MLSGLDRTLADTKCSMTDMEFHGQLGGCQLLKNSAARNFMYNFLSTVAFSALCNLLVFLSLSVNPLNPELNPICYLLALLGAHHFLHVSKIRVKLLTFRLLMSYIWSTHS